MGRSFSAGFQPKGVRPVIQSKIIKNLQADEAGQDGCARTQHLRVLRVSINGPAGDERKDDFGKRIPDKPVVKDLSQLSHVRWNPAQEPLMDMSAPYVQSVAYRSLNSTSVGGSEGHRQLPLLEKPTMRRFRPHPCTFDFADKDTEFSGLRSFRDFENSLYRQRPVSQLGYILLRFPTLFPWEEIQFIIFSRRYFYKTRIVNCPTYLLELGQPEFFI